MIEFTLNRNRNGKKSRWTKKYPRKRILKRGSEKAAEYHYQNRVDEHHVAVWMLIIAFIIYCIPIIGIMAFIAYHIWFFILASRKPHHRYEYLIIELSKENVLHRILGTVACYLTKEV